MANRHHARMKNFFVTMVTTTVGHCNNHCNQAMVTITVTMVTMVTIGEAREQEN